MTTFTARCPVPSRAAIPNAMLGMALFIVVELMFFAGLISSLVVLRLEAVSWPPLGQARFPLLFSLFNTTVLTASGWVLWRRARTAHTAGDLAARSSWLTITSGLGLLFLLLQGIEWTQLISFGISVRGDVYGGFFALLVGAHALHVIGAVAVLIWASRASKRQDLNDGAFGASSILWYFVVILWWIIYVLIYVW